MISVVLPLYNAARVVGGQLDALAGQAYSGAWELIVADNGSTDGSPAIVERWRDRIPSMRVIDASIRRGAAAARNLGAVAGQRRSDQRSDHDGAVATVPPEQARVLDRAFTGTGRRVIELPLVSM